VAKQTQHFNIIPHSPLQGGDAAYTADLISGQLAYLAHIKIKIVFFTTTKTFQGNYQIDPKLMLSSGLSKVAQSQTIAGLTLTVTKVNGSLATVRVSQSQLNGIAVLDISGDYLQVVSMNTLAHVSGQVIVVEVVQAHLF